jgi:flavorubredoxin
MTDVFKAVEVCPSVYWVGAVDWAVRDFHGYLTSRGTTYNAYLILSETITLIDTVKAGFADEMMARIESVVDPARIDCVISNHAEPDHSGELVSVIEAVQPEKVLASAQGAKALDEHFGIGDRLTAVGDGEELSLGELSVIFAETRMCHWPDSMVTYLPARKLLFSQDGFGMHLASYERFDDELPAPLLAEEAAKYYANILMPLSNFIAKALAKVTEAGWELGMIAPDHGPIWRANPGGIVADYARWSGGPKADKAVVVYDTMWGSTERMARAVAEGLCAGGAAVKLMSLKSCHRSDIATEMLDAGALVAGAPTLNNQMFPTLADCLTYLKGLKPKPLTAAAFGSYGWSGEATKQIAEVLADMGADLPAEPVRSKYAPEKAALSQCFELGTAVAESLSARLADKP